MAVGLVRVELTTSRLSGVRSNHLSYRPMRCPMGSCPRSEDRATFRSGAGWHRLALALSRSDFGRSLKTG